MIVGIHTSEVIVGVVACGFVLKNLDVILEVSVFFEALLKSKHQVKHHFGSVDIVLIQLLMHEKN